MTLNWLHIGGRGIDTAFDYGNQQEVGAAVNASRVPRGDVFVTTKIAPLVCTKDASLAAVHVDVQKLGLGKIDLVLHHYPCATDKANKVPKT